MPMLKQFDHILWLRLNLLQAKDVAGEEVDGLDLNIYNTSTYIFIGISAIVVIISFFGCCGAWKVHF